MKKWMIALAALWLGLCAGCGSVADVGTGDAFSLYYLNGELDQLETVRYTPLTSDKEAMVTELIGQQGAAPQDGGMVPLLPEGTQIRSYELDGTLLTLDFNAMYSNMFIGREALVRGGLVREFLQVDGIERVAFTVEGEPLKDSYGEEIGAMNKNSFVENSAETINAYQSAKMTLYFTDETGTRLLPETRKVYYISSEPPERAVVEELAKGPSASGLYPSFAPDISVLSVVMQDGVCYVNLGSTDSTSNLNASEEVQIYSIVDSLADTCGVEKVQFSIDGDSTGVFRRDMSMSEQYSREESLIG